MRMRTIPHKENKYVCPICGCDDVELLYKNYDGKVLGCDNCVKEYDLYDLHLTQDQERKQAAEDMRLDESRGK